jgi:hypothetical protein
MRGQCQCLSFGAGNFVSHSVDRHSNANLKAVTPHHNLGASALAECARRFSGKSKL